MVLHIIDDSREFIQVFDQKGNQLASATCSTSRVISFQYTLLGSAHGIKHDCLDINYYNYNFRDPMFLLFIIFRSHPILKQTPWVGPTYVEPTPGTLIRKLPE